MSDYVLNKQVKISQPDDAFCTGLDAVLLAMSSPIIKSGLVLDAGAGVGTVGLCYAFRTSDSVHMTAIEKHSIFSQYCENNVEDNNKQDRFTVVNDDIANKPFSKANFDLVITNPPYEKSESADTSRDELKNIANIESSVDLSSWIEFCIDVLKQRGTLVMIHKMERLDAILHALHIRTGDIRVLPIVTKEGTNPKRVIVSARRSLKAGLVMHTPLVVNNSDGKPTDFIQNVLYGKECIEL